MSFIFPILSFVHFFLDFVFDKFNQVLTWLSAKSNMACKESILW